MPLIWSYWFSVCCVLFLFCWFVRKLLKQSNEDLFQMITEHTLYCQYLTHIPSLTYELKVQYDVGLPFAASALLGRLSTRIRNSFMMIFDHLSGSAFLRSHTDVGREGLALSVWSNSSQIHDVAVWHDVVSGSRDGVLHSNLAGRKYKDIFNTFIGFIIGRHLSTVKQYIFTNNQYGGSGERHQWVSLVFSYGKPSTAVNQETPGWALPEAFRKATKWKTLCLIDFDFKKLSSWIMMMMMPLMSLEILHKDFQGLRESLEFIQTQVEMLMMENKVLRATVRTLPDGMTHLSTENKNIKDSIIELQACSMRDNLLISGILEQVRRRHWKNDLKMYSEAAQVTRGYG